MSRRWRWTTESACWRAQCSEPLPASIAISSFNIVLASLVKRPSPVQSRERLNRLHLRLCCRGLPGVFPFYKEKAPQFTAPLAIAVGKNWMHRGNANFAKEITPVVCPEAQQNPSHPVISESYRGSEHALPDPKNCMAAARANVGFHKY